MASEQYNNAVSAGMNNGIQWDSAKDYRVLLLVDDAGLTFTASNATVADVLAIAGNNEPVDASYARVAIPQVDRSVVQSARAAQAHIANPVDFGSLDNETIGIAIIYEHVTNDADSLPIIWWDSVDFPATANGAGFTLDDPAAGIFEFAGVTT